jgi:hypothetical protein
MGISPGRVCCTPGYYPAKIHISLVFPTLDSVISGIFVR